MSVEKVTKQFILKEKIDEATDTVTLRFSPVEGIAFPFIPGQFVNIYFLDDRVGGQGKPYSISSTPQDAFYDITVKKIGRFSGALHDLAVGETVSMSEPQGYFYPEEQIARDVVFLAGGVGVTPFYSIIKDILAKDSSLNMMLFYSNKTKADAAFAEELDELKEKYTNLKVVYVFTQQSEEKQAKHESTRIDVAMIKRHLGILNGKQYFICGSIGFVRDLWKELKQNGVPEEHLQVESFY